MMQQKDQQALGLQLQPQECACPFQQYALITRETKKGGRGVGSVTWGSYQILMTSALNVFQTSAGGQGRSGTEGGGEERGGTMMG